MVPEIALPINAEEFVMAFSIRVAKLIAMLLRETLRINAC